jgi:hypothetical protein
MDAQNSANSKQSFSIRASIGEVEHHYSGICINVVLQEHRNKSESTTETKTERSRNGHRELWSQSLSLKPNLNYALVITHLTLVSKVALEPGIGRQFTRL